MGKKNSKTKNTKSNKDTRWLIVRAFSDGGFWHWEILVYILLTVAGFVIFERFMNVNLFNLYEALAIAVPIVIIYVSAVTVLCMAYVNNVHGLSRFITVPLVLINTGYLIFLMTLLKGAWQ